MQQRGLATLWGTSVLLILTSLWGWLCLQSVSAESMRSQHQMQAAQALVHAEALLETAIAQLDALYAKPLPAADLNLWSSALANSCPIDKPAPQWQCMQWSLSELPLTDGIDVSQSSVRLLRDVRHAPHIVQIYVDAKLNAAQVGAGSRATLQQSIYVPLNFPPFPTPTGSTFSTLIVNDMVISPATPICEPQSWRTIFGDMTPAQLKTSSEQQRLNGLNASTLPARSIYWIDSPLMWTQSLGTNTAPVLLIFSETACAMQCPAIHAQIVGTVFYQNQCQVSKLPNLQNSIIWGQLGVESNLTSLQKQALLLNPNLIVGSQNAHAAFTFEWPEGIQAARVQRVAGHWKNAAY